MKTFFSQNRILIWLVIFLLIINVAAISTILIIRVRKVNDTSFIPHARFHREGRMPGEGGFLKEFLELDEGQFEQFRDARHGFQARAWDITEELREKKFEFLRELHQNEPDTNKIQEISEDIGRLHKRLRLESGKYYLELRRFCSEEQQRKLYHFFMQTFDGTELRHGHDRDRVMHHRKMRRNMIRHKKDSI
jgi:hypothetical protein